MNTLKHTHKTSHYNMYQHFIKFISAVHNANIN